MADKHDTRESVEEFIIKQAIELDQTADKDKRIAARSMRAVLVPALRWVDDELQRAKSGGDVVAILNAITVLASTMYISVVKHRAKPGREKTILAKVLLELAESFEGIDKVNIEEIRKSKQGE